MNIIILQGNVGEDPRIKDFEGGGKVAQFSLATTEKGFKTADGREVPDETTWHNIVVKKSGLAGVCQQFVKKGTPLLIKGRITNRQYSDAQGITRYITEVVVDDLTLLGKKERENAPAPEPEYKPRTSGYGAPAMPGGVPQGGYQRPPQSPYSGTQVNTPPFEPDNDMPLFDRDGNFQG